MLHGEPTRAFLYRKLIPPLAGVARALAPDYIGFGRSDKPTRIEDYSYDFEASDLLGAVDGLLADGDLRSRLAAVSARVQASPGTVKAAGLLERLARDGA